jgi:hypothetical protein
MFLPRQIVALGKIVSKAATRFAYSTVRIERHEGGPRAMATDGRRAVMFTWDEPDRDKFAPIEGLSSQPARQFAANVPPKALADAGKGIAKRRGHSANNHLLLDESSTSLVRLAGSSNGKIIQSQATVEEASFPDCNAVLPTPAREGKVYEPSRHGPAAFTHTRIGVNAKQLAQTLAVVSDLAADDPHNTVVMTVPLDPDRPIRLDARCTGRRAAAAIMPTRTDFAEYDRYAPPQGPAALPSPARKPRRSRKASSQASQAREVTAAAATEANLGPSS